MSAVFSAGEDEAKMKEELQSLQETGWILDEDYMGIKKTYYFKTYTKVLDFHMVIGVRCKSKNHHPKMETGAGHVTVHWTTHFPRGLSSKDTFMARYCDEQARDNIKTTERSEARKCGPTKESVD
ncbi:Transcriptional coactivator/pterin dehydratase [Elaphomyces granulatus]